MYTERSIGRRWRRSMSWCCFFFKQKTAYDMRISDWSSDVCSSDLTIARQIEREGHADRPPPSDQHWGFDHVRHSESISLGFLFPDSSGQSEGSDACIMTAPASDLTDQKIGRAHV